MKVLLCAAAFYSRSVQEHVFSRRFVSSFASANHVQPSLPTLAAFAFVSVHASRQPKRSRRTEVHYEGRKKMFLATSERAEIIVRPYLFQDTVRSSLSPIVLVGCAFITKQSAVLLRNSLIYGYGIKRHDCHGDDNPAISEAATSCNSQHPMQHSHSLSVLQDIYKS